jgi:uncharacterized RDD family membrane protein YckC
MEAVGVGRRAVAIIIDSILLMVIGWALALVMGSTSGAGFGLEGAPALLWFLIAMAYYVVMEVTSGGTIGKKVMGLKVVMAGGGGAISWQASIIRNLLRIVDGLFFYLVGAIVVWVSKGKRLGDMAAKTLVVRSGASG